MNTFFDPHEDVHVTDDGLVISSDQYIGDDFFDELKDMKEDFKFQLDGYTPVATIPEAVVNKWLREGFDFWDAPANEIIKKLKSENMETMVISGDKTF